MSHTPGPWTVYRWDGHRSVSSDDSASGFGFVANGYRLPLCDLEGDIETAEANARLVAAAPDLLEALEALYAVAPSKAPASGMVVGIEQRHAEACAKALTAIKKARGKS